MRSLLDFEDLNKAVISGSVIGVDVAEDEFHSVLVDEALDQSVEVVLVKGAVSTVSLPHHVDDEAANFRQLDHLPKGGRKQMSFGKTTSAS